MKARTEGAGEDRGPLRRRRRILYNLDGYCHLYLKRRDDQPGQITGDDLRGQVREATQPGSQLDTLLVCVNCQAMYYPTGVGTMCGALLSAGARAALPPDARQWLANLESFYARDVDPYATILDEAKKRGLEALVSFRMNDNHNLDFERTQFWLDHPECRLSGALDFTYDEVREYTFRLIEELVQRYDCDGIELDFNRWPTFFSGIPCKNGGTYDERIRLMNALVERIRQLLDEEGRKRDRRLVLGVRVPSDYGNAPTTYDISLRASCDPVAWAATGWIDFLTVSEFLHERYALPIREWRQLITGIPIYGGIECTDGKGREYVMTADKYRRAASRRWAEGADGIYLFNFHTCRDLRPSACEPPFEVLSEIGDP